MNCLVALSGRKQGCFESFYAPLAIERDITERRATVDEILKLNSEQRTGKRSDPTHRPADRGEQ